MPKHGKKYRSVVEGIDRDKKYSFVEAIDAAKTNKYTKFDETVEMCVNLNVNPRHADQMIRSTVVLPNGTGRSVTVLVLAKGDKIEEAKTAGADYAGDEFIEKIQSGWTGFDVAIATPDMMGVVGKLGKILGPRGLMPNPKTGTVTMDVAKAVKEAKAGKINFRVDKAGIIHAPVGKLSFETNQIKENCDTLIDALEKLRPSSVKGNYIKGVVVSSTMGLGYKIDLSQN